MGQPSIEQSYSRKLSSLKTQRNLWGIAGVAILIAAIALVIQTLPIITVVELAAVALCGIKVLQKTHQRHVLEKQMASELDAINRSDASRDIAHSPSVDQGVTQEQERAADYWQNSLASEQNQPGVVTGRGA